jgi:hypothetical protein
VRGLRRRCGLGMKEGMERCKRSHRRRVVVPLGQRFLEKERVDHCWIECKLEHLGVDVVGCAWKRRVADCNCAIKSCIKRGS